jgi:hypothetical protein
MPPSGASAGCAAVALCAGTPTLRCALCGVPCAALAWRAPPASLRRCCAARGARCLAPSPTTAHRSTLFRSALCLAPSPTAAHRLCVGTLCPALCTQPCIALDSLTGTLKPARVQHHSTVWAYCATAFFATSPPSIPRTGSGPVVIPWHAVAGGRHAGAAGSVSPPVRAHADSRRGHSFASGHVALRVGGSRRPAGAARHTL